MAAVPFVLKLVSAIVVVSALENSSRPTKEEWDAAQQEERDQVSAKQARENKLAAVNKAVDMLEGLRTQVLKEGEEEAATYNKFSCFCKDTTQDRLHSIKTGEDQQEELTTEIGSLEQLRDELDGHIQTHLEHIKDLEVEMKLAVEERRKIFNLYSKNSVDLSGALEALEGAIQTLKASKTPTLVQMSSISETVRTAALLADALGLGGKAAQRASTLFLQDDPANEVQMEDYKYHSDDIVQTLEGLLEDFKNEKKEVDEAEVNSVRGHDLLMQAKTHEKKVTTRELNQARKHKAQTAEGIGVNSQQLSTVEATLRQDKEYTNELSQMCGDKARTWDQRTQARADELSTLTEAIGMVRGAVKGNTSANTIRFAQKGVSIRFAKVVAVDVGSMNAIEAAAEEAESPALVQVASTRRGMLRASVRRQPGAADSRDVVVRLLKAQGQELKSTLLTALASKIAADPFAKVKQLIQELIERLLQEATNEANQKGWCDKATADAKQNRDYAVEEITALNSVLEKLEADRERLSEELSILADDILELENARSNATEDRAEEKAQNEATIGEADEGLSALDLCIDLLDKFYKTLKKNETVDLSLMQGPADDAPDSGFANGEAYTGAQSEAGGILGMLDVMKSDFVRTVRDTEKAEVQAEQDHLAFMTETGKTLAQKNEAHSQKTDQKDDVIEKYEDADESFLHFGEVFRGALDELKELKPTCIDTGMSYEDRVSRRQEEIDSLNKALCILGKYEQYGPEGANSC